MIRVAALIATDAVSGPGRQLAAIVPRLAHSDIEVHVVLLQRSRSASAYESYLAERGVRYRVITDRGPLDRGVFKQAEDAVRELAPAVLQTHGYKASAVGWYLRRSLPGLRWLAFYHGSTRKDLKDALYQFLERRCFRRADEIVVVAETLALDVKRGGRPVSVIANAVIADSGNWSAAAENRAFDWERCSRPLLGVVGRLSREKGLDVFLRACVEVGRVLPDFSALIVGEGSEDRGLRTLARELGIEERIHFCGHVADVERVYAALDALVLPSRNEGLPNVLLEALARDLPVVATTVGAVPEVLQTQHAGVLVPPDDAPALAQGILQCLREGRSEAAIAARRSAVGRYGLGRRVEEHVRLYRRIAAADDRQTV